MSVPSERLTLEALAAMRQIATPADPAGEAEDALGWLPPVFGASAFALVALDRQGAALPLRTTLPAALEPPLLEVLESDALWELATPGATLTASGLAEKLSLVPWPEQLGARFYTGPAERLGVLLLQAPTVPEGGAQAALADRCLMLLLRQWRLGREQHWLGAFTRALLGAQQRGVLAIDAQGTVVHLNDTGAEILGLDAEQAVGSDCTRVVRPAVTGEHPLLAGLAGKLDRIELYVADQRGRDVLLSLRMQPMVDPDGATEGLVCLFRDPSLERAFDQEARRRERLAVIGELAAGVAHEIRNPLTGIGNCAQVLQGRLAADESNRKMADLILRETQRLERIITSLLKFARPGPPAMRPTKVEEVVRATLELDEAAREQAGVRMELRVAGRIPTIFVDPEQIQQVLVNLFRNASEAMPDGGLLRVELEVVRRPLHLRRNIGRRATDRVRIVREGPQARFVRIRVTDTGKGIPEESLPRIFDPFYTTRSGGTGLGLAVSQSIIQEHGGSISVQSRSGSGAVFEVDLPVERRQGERRREDHS